MDFYIREVDMRCAVNLFVDLTFHRRIHLNSCFKPGGQVNNSGNKGGRVGVARPGVLDALGDIEPEIIAAAVIVACADGVGFVDRRRVRTWLRTHAAKFANAKGVHQVMIETIFIAGGLDSIEMEVDISGGASEAEVGERKRNCQLALVATEGKDKVEMKIPLRQGWPTIPNAKLKPFLSWTDLPLATRIFEYARRRWPRAPMVEAASPGAIQ